MIIGENISYPEKFISPIKSILRIWKISTDISFGYLKL